MNIGFIGTGQRSWGYVKYINKMNNQKIIISGVFDTCPKRSQHFCSFAKKKFNINVINHKSIESLLSSGINIVFICTPDFTHLQVALKCINSNINMILEKPICISKKEYDILDKSKGNVKIFVPFVLRFLEFFSKIKELIPKIGNITRFDMKLDLSYSHSASYHRRWHKNTDNCGSFLLTKCCHDIDILLWLNGNKYNKICSFGNKKKFKEKFMGNCSNCDKDCKFRFDGKYVFMTGNDIKQFDQCIFDNKHDIVDHQTCMIDYGTYVATYSVCMYQNKGNRTICINGDNGFIKADYNLDKIIIQIGSEKPVEYIINTSTSGHKGSDIKFLEKIQEMYVSGNIDDILYDEAITCIDLCINLDESMKDQTVKF